MINISSCISKIPLPFLGSYGATKSALNALTDTLRLELMLFDKKIVNILLGVVNTGVAAKQAQKITQFSHSIYLPYLLERMDKAPKREVTSSCTPEYAAQSIYWIAQQLNPNNDYIVANNPYTLRLAASIRPTMLYQHIIKNIILTCQNFYDKMVR